MFVRVWEFRPQAGCEGEFRRVYGSAGEWAQLFGRARGFLGTDLLARGGDRFLTLDRWRNAEDWDAFLRDWSDEYSQLDRACERLVEIDREIAVLRRARLDDADALAALSGELGYPTDLLALRSRLELIDRQPDELVLAAEHHARTIAGWVHVFGAVRLESAPFAEIGGLIVAAAARSSGIGHALLGSAEAWARAHGFAEMHVRSNVVRDRAHAFYERCGYRSPKSQRVFIKPLS
jgi:N-acetylglutamate synthase-like GNAT family acetyltransferase/heme-degrading monooxygenase HmoA